MIRSTRGRRGEQKSRRPKKISGEGDNAAVNLQSADGTATLRAGGDAKLSSWLPAYPSPMAKGSLTSTVNGMTQSGFGFNAADRSSNVLEYYQPQLKTSGFDIKQSVAAGESGILVAESGGRTVTATVGGSGEKPNVSLMAIQQQ